MSIHFHHYQFSANGRQKSFEIVSDCMHVNKYMLFSKLIISLVKFIEMSEGLREGLSIVNLREQK